MIDIKVVRAFDYESLYVNGLKITEGENITWWDWFKLGQRFPNINSDEIEWITIDNDKFIFELIQNGMPKKYSSLPRNKTNE